MFPPLITWFLLPFITSETWFVLSCSFLILTVVLSSEYNFFQLTTHLSKYHQSNHDPTWRVRVFPLMHSPVYSKGFLYFVMFIFVRPVHTCRHWGSWVVLHVYGTTQSNPVNNTWKDLWAPLERDRSPAAAWAWDEIKSEGLLFLCEKTCTSPPHPPSFPHPAPAAP